MKTQAQVMKTLEDMKIQIENELVIACHNRGNMVGIVALMPSMVNLIEFQIKTLMMEENKVLTALQHLQSEAPDSLEKAIQILETDPQKVYGGINSKFH